MNWLKILTKTSFQLTEQSKLHKIISGIKELGQIDQGQKGINFFVTFKLSVRIGLLIVDQPKMKKLIDLFLIFLFTNQAFAQGVPSDTTHYLLAGNQDKYSSWSFYKQSGTTGTIGNYEGLNGDGIQISYSFPATGGWVTMDVPFGSSFTKSNPMVFFIHTTNSTDKLEIKFIDNDGSVFDIKPILSSYSGGWHHVTAYLENANYDWGGNASFDTPNRFSLAISGSTSSSGTVCFDEIGVGKPRLPSSFLSNTDPNARQAGIGFTQRREASIAPEDPLVLKFLEGLQDQGTPAKNLTPTYLEGNQAQTFNNCLAALAFLSKDEKERAERILDFYQNATDSANTDSLKQNFFYKKQARGFYQECDIHTLKAMGAKNRWIGDMAWLLITCRNYQKKYNSTRYNYLVKIIKELFLSFYMEAKTGGYIQHGWENGDARLHENYGHHEGNIDCYVALKLCGEDFYAHQVKIWLDNQLDGNNSLPLDLYTWRALAFGAMGDSYIALLNIPEYDFRYRKIINVKGKDLMGLYSSPDITIENFWNDGTGHISCAFQAFGDRQRGYFYANQLDQLLVGQTIGTTSTRGISYTLNTQGYPGVDPTVPVLSSSAWYILAKNGVNPFMSGNFKDDTANLAASLKTGTTTLRIFPDPFSDQTSISFHAIQNSGTVINIFDLNGFKINAVNFMPTSGENNYITWDGRNFAGRKVPTGIYLIQVITENQIEISRILYLGE